MTHSSTLLLLPNIAHCTTLLLSAASPYLLDPARCADHDVWALLLVLQHVLVRLDVHASKEVAHLHTHGLAEALKLTANLQQHAVPSNVDEAPTLPQSFCPSLVLCA